MLVVFVQNVRVGNNGNAVLGSPQRTEQASEGCDVADPCDADPFPCPADSFCQHEWGQHSCRCQPGRMGPQCDSVCDAYNPCAIGSKCKKTASSSTG